MFGWSLPGSSLPAGSAQAGRRRCGMPRGLFRGGSAVLVLAAVWCAFRGEARAAPPSDARPNILLIFSDDHAMQSIGAYGAPFRATPNLDRLAREGMLFRHCLVTNSICGPSRATVLTGKYSHLNG